MNDLASRLKTEGFVELTKDLAARLQKEYGYNNLVGSEVVTEFFAGNENCLIRYIIFNNGTVLEMIDDTHMEARELRIDDVKEELRNAEGANFEEVRKYAGLYRKILSVLEGLDK